MTDTKPTLAIWWLAPGDFETIDAFGDLPTWLPAYVTEEYRSARGRNGRGRLWVPKKLTHLLPPGGGVAGQSFGSAIGCACGKRAGVVVEAHVVRKLMNLPGLVTNFYLQRWDSYA